MPCPVGDAEATGSEVFSVSGHEAWSPRRCVTVRRSEMVPPRFGVSILLRREAEEPRFGLAITGCHFPPGTSTWYKIEHRLFAYISSAWRGRPLVSLAVIVNLIGATRTATGLRVRCELDRGTYPKGRTISDEQLASLRLTPHRFHGDWNYTIHPVRRR